MEHKCKTYDGVVITPGLRVKDYDAEVGTVVEPDWPCDLTDEVCWPKEGHAGHWWLVRRDSDGRTKSFDGSRLTTRGL